MLFVRFGTGPSYQLDRGSDLAGSFAVCTTSTQFEPGHKRAPVTLLHGTQSGFCWLVDQVKEINMPMLFWLPAIIVSGWWSMVAKELDVL
jgi:hypothetical protein